MDIFNVFYCPYELQQVHQRTTSVVLSHVNMHLVALPKLSFVILAPIPPREMGEKKKKMRDEERGKKGIFPDNFP